MIESYNFINVIIVILLSSISVFYYLRIIKIIFFEPKTSNLKTNKYLIHIDTFLSSIDYFYISIGLLLLMFIFLNPTFLFLSSQYILLNTIYF